LKPLIALLLLGFTLFSFAEEVKIKDDEEIPHYIPRVRSEFSTREKAINFGTVYGAQWTYYLIGQNAEIKDHGNLDHWWKNPFSPHFDKDSFDYNIFKHSLTGNYYFLFYRSRGYTEQNAFIWSFLSSLAFEFTIETITERPSWQDIYQTPVFGTVVGMGSERLSRYLHSKGTWWGNTLGYILNPFTLLPETPERQVSFNPIYDRKVMGATLTYRY
jgi:Domain of unknown function (DUF3943)